MKKRRIILSVGMALIALSNVNSYGAPVYGDSLSISGTNGDNIAQVYAMPSVTNSYLTQSAVTTDGNVTYNNSSLIQQLTTQGSAFFQSRAEHKAMT